MKRLLAAVAIAILILAGVIAVRTATFRTPSVPRVTSKKIGADENQLAARLAAAIRFRTVSTQDPAQFAGAPFRAFQQYLGEAFPAAHTRLQFETICEYSLLYTWPGSDPSLNPILLIAHQDVVPVAQETEKDWSHPAFDGVIADGFVWGRGALDDKSSLMAILEAVEALLRDGYQPKRTIYLAFGHDEEVGGSQGAPKIAEILKNRGVHLECAVDEGETIVEGVVPGVSVPVAVVGLAEKGYLSLELSVEGRGGHSATPPKNTALGILARAITRIENHPFPAHLECATQFFRHLAPQMPVLERAVFANLWLTAPLVKRIFANDPTMNAAIRTTSAATLCNAGVKENVLPNSAVAVINFRIMPGDTVESVIERVNTIVNDERVHAKPLAAPNGPSRVSDLNAPSYAALVKSILETAPPDTVAAPFMVLGASDSRHYESIADNVYRFLPIRMSKEDLDRIHGTNERIAVNDYARMVSFYTQLIRNSNPS
jgi:carboxypeptidase PM20D1